jgi:hypothetical protein
MLNPVLKHWAIFENGAVRRLLSERRAAMDKSPGVSAANSTRHSAVPSGLSENTPVL